MKNAIILTDFTDSVSLTRIYGPYKVAHELRKYGVDVTVINFLHMWSYEEIINLMDKLINKETIFVGVNNFFYQDISGIDVYDDTKAIHFGPADANLLLPHGQQASRNFLKYLKDKNQTLVLGGPIAFDIELNKNFDYIIQQFTEKSIINFVEHKVNGVPLINAYKSIYGPTIIRDINKEENYDFSNSDFQWHDDDCVMDFEVLNIEVARGCIFKCNFCCFPMIGKKKFDYIKNFDVLRNELIDNYNRFGTTRYYFSDETFNDSVEKVSGFYEMTRTLPFKIEYFAYLRLDLADRFPETIPMLVDSGLKYTHFGIETLHPDARKTINKTLSLDRARATLKTFRELSDNEINLHATFMTGLPYETESDVRATYEVLANKDLGLDSYFFLPLTIYRKPFPQSYFSENYQQFGYEIINVNDPDYQTRFKEIEKTTNSLSQFPGPGVIWKNSTNQMDYFVAHDLAREFNRAGHKNNKLGAVAAFGIAGLGMGDEYWKHKTYADTEWFEVVKTKRQRFNKYKNMLSDVVDRKYNGQL